MSTNTPAPGPAGKRPDPGTTVEEPGQDESGKTSAPQSPQGLEDKSPAPADSTQPSGDTAGDDDAAQPS